MLKYPADKWALPVKTYIISEIVWEKKSQKVHLSIPKTHCVLLSSIITGNIWQDIYTKVLFAWISNQPAANNELILLWIQQILICNSRISLTQSCFLFPEFALILSSFLISSGSFIRVKIISAVLDIRNKIIKLYLQTVEFKSTAETLKLHL